MYVNSYSIEPNRHPLYLGIDLSCRVVLVTSVRTSF